VWITYRPGLAREDIARLRGLARGHTYILVSAYKALPAPIVASAWSRQIRLDGVDDPRLVQFVQAFRLTRLAPETGKPCSGGAGHPG
jgi:hypothetical protein